MKKNWSPTDLSQLKAIQNRPLPSLELVLTFQDNEGTMTDTHLTGNLELPVTSLHLALVFQEVVMPPTGGREV